MTEPLKRYTPLRRSNKGLQRKPIKAKTARRAKMTPDEAAVVLRRSRGMCEMCGAEPATNIHHRNRDKADNRPENLLHLCGFGNASGCHGLAHTHPDRYVNGWLVRRGDDPATVEFRRPRLGA